MDDVTDIVSFVPDAGHDCIETVPDNEIEDVRLGRTPDDR